jgi:hypothetical protein
MTRLTIALSIAAVLLLAAAAGWAACWFWSRPARRAGADAERLSALTADLHAAEIAAEAARRRAEAAEAALAEARTGADAAAASRIAELRAELAAAMDALGDARRDAEGWRRAYETATTPDEGP